MINQKFIIGVVIVLITIIGILAYFLVIPNTDTIKSIEQPTLEQSITLLYPNLSWEEVPVDKQTLSNFSNIGFCPSGEKCYLNDYQPIPLLSSVRKREYFASIKHDPPLKNERSQSFSDFLNYYDNKLLKLGFISDSDRPLYLPEYGGSIIFYGGEKLSQTTRSYGLIKDGTLQIVVIQNYTGDSKNCPDEQKNIFGTCNLNVEEFYYVHITDKVLLSDIF